jgi:hypothetical protein
MRLEQLVRQHNVVDSPIAAMDLETGMVFHFERQLRVVISVTYKNTKSGPTVVVESMTGLHTFPSDAQLYAWHIDGRPFIVDPPPEDLGPYKPFIGGGSAPPAQDAAGIVPVCRAPKRLN